MTHQSLRKLNQPRCDAAAVHQFSGQHKKRQRHQWKAVHTIVDIAVEQGDVTLLPIEPQQNTGCEEKREKDGQSNHQEKQEYRKEENKH